MQRNLSIGAWDRILPLALILGGAAIAVIALGADLLNVGGPQGIGPKQVSLALSGAALLLAGVVWFSPFNRRHIGEWLLVGLAAVVVAFASDLLVINGLPEFWFKQLVVASIGLGVLVTAAVPASTIERRPIGAWLNQLIQDRVAFGKFLTLAAQLGVLVLVAQQFKLENQAFYYNLMLLSFYSFLIHYFLPSRYRLPFFVLVSLLAIVGILGLANATWLVAMGLALIGICHLPIRYSVRVLLLLAAGAVLVAVRVNWLPVPGLEVVWPVVASMFMFRLIIYVYDLKHGKAKPTIASTLAYFFLMPNVVFPFFPVVDYSTFRRTYYDDEQHRIYQSGLDWMLRGVVQLIVYRYINYYLTMAPQDVTNSAELVRYLISNFALYLRISGQFHVIIGILHLFGFNLPETHHLYFMASSFLDLWRRINIYWKDFMLKVFYYPTFFRIKQWGANASLIVATFFVFFLTWFFHAYQWFWLRGAFLFTAPDMLFWFILALLVVVNTLYEAKRGRKRTLGQRSVSLGEIVAQALRAAAVFSTMAVLWALWSSESIQEWLSLFAVVSLTWQSLATLGLSFLAIAAVFTIVLWIGARSDRSNGSKTKQPAFFRSAAVTGGSVLLLYLIASPAVYSQIGGQPQALIQDLTTNRLSAQEAALLQRGYYEDLIGVSRFNSQLWDIYSKRPSDWPPITETEAVRQTGDNLIIELVPSTKMIFQGALLSINRWGMRDQDYEQLPAPGTYRVALMGPSFVMGSGVADGEDFEALVEARLNNEYSGSRYAKYEILNFAVPGYSAIQDLMVLEQKAVTFQPNALFFVAHQRDEESVVLYLADRLSVGAVMPYDYLNELASRAGVKAGMSKVEIERLLKPFGSEILAWTYRRTVEVSQAHGITPAWVFVPTLEYPLDADTIAHLSSLADEAGFIVLNLADAYANQDADSIVVAYWDKHPNAKGHRLIAESLYQALWEKKAEIPLFP